MTKKLRFAPLIRVSTLKQKDKGESLNTQKERIIKAVDSLCGDIPDRCWKYSGQESASINQERQLLDKLLEDSSKGIFDAVNVDDPSRWSRDTYKSTQGLNILRDNNIRFFILTTEVDLFKPMDLFNLGMQTEMNQFFSLEQARKSIINRIARAERNIPSTGKLPYGRTFDKATEKWGLDIQKQEWIKWASEQYLKGESLQKIADKLEMNMPNLWKILTKRSGTEWEVSFESKKNNIKETRTIIIPELLPQKTIDLIKKRAAHNKKYTHGITVNKYLLSGMVKCSSCGYGMFGQTNHQKHRYYRHARHRKNKCTTDNLWIRADDIENAVLVQLFAMYGDTAGIEKAISKAIPNLKEVQSLRKEKANYEKKLKGLEKEIRRIVKSIRNDIISDEDAKKDREDIKKREEFLKNEIEKIDYETENIPTEMQIMGDANFIKMMIKRTFNTYVNLPSMTFEDRRKLMERVFSGNTIDEQKKLGVFVEKDSKGVCRYQINGAITKDISGSLPMSRDEVEEILHLDPEHDSDFDPFAERPKKAKGKTKSKNLKDKNVKRNSLSIDKNKALHDATVS